jgi:hypothetical protein
MRSLGREEASMKRIGVVYVILIAACGNTPVPPNLLSDHASADEHSRTLVPFDKEPPKS